MTAGICLLSVLFFSCITANDAEIENDTPEINFSFEGSFDSNQHSDGQMQCVLYSDNTLTGSWVTENNTVTIDIRGNYIIKNEEIYMTAFGKSILRSETESNVIVICSGRMKQRFLAGYFTIYIENADFPNDIGFWEAWIEEYNKPIDYENNNK